MAEDAGNEILDLDNLVIVSAPDPHRVDRDGADRHGDDDPDGHDRAEDQDGRHRLELRQAVRWYGIPRIPRVGRGPAKCGADDRIERNAFKEEQNLMFI